ncbi:hypothetical protein Cf24236_1067 [Citrobacter farmeri]|nr:hypothetical protein Cf24236_1067 [Citrobacter farmeri]
MGLQLYIVRIYSSIDKLIPSLKFKFKGKRFLGRVDDALDNIEMFT